MTITAASLVGLGFMVAHNLFNPQLSLQEMCVAKNVWFESSLAHQPADGDKMAAYVVVARAQENREKWGGDTYCGVVLKYKQFSWTLSMRNHLRVPRGVEWGRAVQATLVVTRGGWQPTDGMERARYYMNRRYAARKNACNFQKEFAWVGEVGDHEFYAEPTEEELINLQGPPVPYECKPGPTPKKKFLRHKKKRKHHRGRH